MCRSIRPNPQIVYASLWEAREGPWENAEWNGTNGGIFKSTDGGKTWKQLSKGLPNDIVQANLAVAPSAPRTALRRGGDAEDGTSFIVPMTRAKPGALGDRGRSSGRSDRRRRFAGRAVRSAESEGRLFRERRLLEIDRRRQDLGRLARRARRRRLSKRLDQSRRIPRSSCLGAIRARSSR